MTGNLDSSSGELAPFLIEPRFVARVWGYLDLHPWYDYAVGPQNGTAGSGDDGQPIGEVWLTGDECRVGSGPYAGTTLGQMFADHPAALLGASSKSPQSPLLIKMIFAREKLSVQVHPDDRLAQKYGQPRGKTECWYALSAEPGAKVAAGLKPGMTMDAGARGDRATARSKQSLNLIPVAPATWSLLMRARCMPSGPDRSCSKPSRTATSPTGCTTMAGRASCTSRSRSKRCDFETRAGIVPPRALDDRTILIDVDYFRVERIAVNGEPQPVPVCPPRAKRRRIVLPVCGRGFCTLTRETALIRRIAAPRHCRDTASSPAFAFEDLGGST